MLAGPELVASGVTTSLAVLSVPAIVVIIGYDRILEGWFGAAAGKAMLGLRVAGQGGSPPGIVRGLLRAAIFASRARAVARAQRRVRGTHGDAQCGVGLDDRDPDGGRFRGPMSRLALLFSTARRRNGYAALHDLGSGTRVVVTRRAIESRHAAAAPAIDPDDLVDVASRIGPMWFAIRRGRPSPPRVPRSPTGMTIDCAGRCGLSSTRRTRPRCRRSGAISAAREGEMAGRTLLGRRVLGRLRSDSRTAADPRDLASAAGSPSPTGSAISRRDCPGTCRRLSSRPGDRQGLGRRGRSRPAPGLAGPTSAGQRLDGGHEWTCAGSGSPDGRPVSGTRSQ